VNVSAAGKIPLTKFHEKIDPPDHAKLLFLLSLNLLAKVNTQSIVIFQGKNRPGKRPVRANCRTQIVGWGKERTSTSVNMADIVGVPASPQPTTLESANAGE